MVESKTLIDVHEKLQKQGVDLDIKVVNQVIEAIDELDLLKDTGDKLLDELIKEVSESEIMPDIYDIEPSKDTHVWRSKDSRPFSDYMQVLF